MFLVSNLDIIYDCNTLWHQYILILDEYEYLRTNFESNVQDFEEEYGIKSVSLTIFISYFGKAIPAILIIHILIHIFKEKYQRIIIMWNSTCIHFLLTELSSV